ncbi:MAG: 50S ribosomal protein L24 [Myxococcales bacterium]|nr:MAG: 50S ribosomal protein L24 [Myxococcales bacterium]
MAARIKKNDLVEVIAGRNKGDRGRVLRIFKDTDRVIVENVNRVKRHQSPQRFKEAGIVEKEAPIHISNVMPVDPKTDKATRVRYTMSKDQTKNRTAARSGSSLES